MHPPSDSSRCVAVILAAGLGKRFRAGKPKVLQELEGRPLVQHVVAAASAIEPSRIVVVLNPRGDEVRQALAASGVRFAVQQEQLGTADAVRSARAEIPESVRELLVLNGDVPLLRASTLVQLLDFHRERDAAATLLTARLEDPAGYGRIVRDEQGRVHAVVEERDADGATRAIDEINSGAYVLRSPLIFDVIETLGTDNAQGEYYLTDVVERLVARGERVEAIACAERSEVLGVNRPEELEALRAYLRSRAGTS